MATTADSAIHPSAEWNVHPDFALEVDEHATFDPSESLFGTDGETRGQADTTEVANDQKYLIPNDTEEHRRLDLQHVMFKLLLDGKLYLAPIESPNYVLDIATGTGRWARQFAAQHPASKVIGTDIEIKKTTDAEVPANYSFLQTDAEESWPFDHKFDYVHLRFVVSCFNETRTVIKNVFDNLNEGGWIEFHDGILGQGCQDGSYEGTANRAMNEQFEMAYKAMGRDPVKTIKYKQWLLDAGFVDVVEKRFPVPMNSWPKDPKYKEIGKYCYHDVRDLTLSLGGRILAAAGLSPEEIERRSRIAIADLGNTSIHIFTPMFVIYGRKPKKGENA
ncbi:S-adenosyl-L-methionine-dependent methyltransferase [Xylariales sp. PMI_506]|nr:S-adenosyl-L-methionine-dependent methyltransferase [Xylariales sp. PMI_506]